METPARPEPVPLGWLTFHLAHPGPGFAKPGDPNCAFFWNGRYHLHYIYLSEDGFAFAHVSSADLVTWRWHPTTLTPSFTGHGMWSGTGFLTREGRPAIVYQGAGPGPYFGYGAWRNQVAIALDDDLEAWTTPRTIEAVVRPDQDGSAISNWDPDAWLEGDIYYALFGGNPGSGKAPTLMRSADLETWDYVGLFLEHDMPDVDPDEDISCPNFFPIDGTHMLLCISHTRGCRYYLGDWVDEKFTPVTHARMNWSDGALHGSRLSYFAPESVLTPDGRRVMWAWCISSELLQTGVQSLPRELALPDDGVLRITPARELEALRSEPRAESDLVVRDGERKILADVRGNALELELVVRAGATDRFGIQVYCDPDSGDGFPVVIDTAQGTISVGPETAPFELVPGDDARLRVFVDANLIEAFAGDRQAVAGVHPHAIGPGNVSIFADGGDIHVASVTTWTLGSIYETA
jgi:beta-fructofuranosidase